jgi:hypothetical protein
MLNERRVDINCNYNHIQTVEEAKQIIFSERENPFPLVEGDESEKIIG